MMRTRFRPFHILLLGLMLMLTACTEGSSSSTQPGSPSPTVGIRITSTPSPLPVQSPTLAPLGPPPHDCPTMPPPQRLDFPHFGKGSDTHFLGSPPVWIAASFLPNTLHLRSASTWKIVVELGPNYLHPVSLRMRDLRAGALAQWTAGDPPKGVTQTVALDPKQQDPSPLGPAAYHGSPEVGWNEWGVFPLFPHAGCYTLEVSWPEGQWQSIFAVGQ
jgi:hypothetical protein